MKIDKPDNVLLLQSYHARGGKPALMVTLAYTQDVDGSYMPEQEVWPWLLTHFVEQPFDTGFKKDRAVFGVAGSAYAPGKQPVTDMAVKAQVGALHKTLHVHGNRQWTHGAAWQPGPAHPFTVMPITLGNAFGGPGWPDNPFGKGWRAGTSPEAGLALPNIELPDAPILATGDQPAVATFSMLPAGAPSRMRWVGAVDDNWQRERFPWLPDDTDPRWFDGVPSDQGMPGYWQGKESWSVQGMHPDHAVVAGSLPGLRPRLLVRRHAAGQGPGAPVAQAQQSLDMYVTEAHLDLDTVWLFPNEQRLMVMYRAAIPVTREDAAEIAALGVFTETQDDTPLTLDDWNQRWTQDQDQEQAAMAMPPLVAAASQVSGPDPQLVAQQQADYRQWVDELTADIQQSLDDGAVQANAAMDQMQVDMQSMADLDLPRITAPRVQAPVSESFTPMNWGGFPENLEAEIKQSLQQGQDLMEASVRKLALDMDLDADELLSYIKAVQENPQTVGTKTIIEHLAGVDMPDDIRPMMMEKAQDVQDQLDAMDVELDAISSSSAAISLPELDTGSQALTREQVLERLAAGTSLAGAILTALDFRDVQFGAADLAGAVITTCDFTRAGLKSAVLDRAKLVACNFSQADLQQASLNDIDVVDTFFIQTNCQSARMRQGSFSGVDLSRSDWTQAVLDGSSIGQSALHNAVFALASMAATNLWEVKGQAVDFSQGRLAGLRVDSHSELDQANFELADLQGASLQDSCFADAVFNQANVSDAFIKNCVLDDSVGWRALVLRTDFKGSSLRNARWPAANFMEASFDSTHLENVDFSGVNLHAAEVRTATVRSIQVRGALLTGCALLQQHGAVAAGGT